MSANLPQVPSIPVVDVTGDLKMALASLDDLLGHLQNLAERAEAVLAQYEPPTPETEEQP